MIEDVEAINKAIWVLKENGLSLKVMERLQRYLSYVVKFSKDEQRAWLGQPYPIKNLVEKFGNHVKNMWCHKMPGMPKFLIIRPMIKSEKILVECQKEYWFGIGKLLFLVKHSRPDFINTTMELSKGNNGANPRPLKNWYMWLSKFWTQRKPTRDTNKSREIVCFCDSDYVGDLISRRSISGFVLYVLGVPVSWQSKAQKSMILSRSEAEWVALPEAMKVVLFVLQLLGSMKISVKHPVMVRIDNVGAIFKTHNITNTTCIKYMDIRYKYIN